MPKHVDPIQISNAASLAVAPARHLSKLTGVSVGTIGASVMIFDTISQDALTAMIIAIIVTALAFLAINYLAEYRDWKYKHQLEYEDALNKLGNKAVKPDLNFSSIYVVSLIVSMVLVSVIAAFTVPLAVKFFVYDPELAAEPTTYFFVSIVFVSIFALFVDKTICRPVADGSFKAKESQVEEQVIADLERKFQNGNVPLSNEAQARLLAAIAEALKKQ